MRDDVTSATWGRKAPPHGETPAVALIDPKYPHNVGMVVRLASCYGLRQVWFTGDRVSLTPARGDRLPREERMKGYRDVTMVHHDHVFDRFPPGTVPVAVEVRAAAEPLHTFEHYFIIVRKAGVNNKEIRHATGDSDIPRLHHIVFINHKNIQLILDFVSSFLRDDQCVLKRHGHQHFACFTIF